MLDKGIGSASLTCFEFMFDYVFFEVGVAAFASIAIFGVDWFDSAAVVAHARCGWSAVTSGLCARQGCKVIRQVRGEFEFCPSSGSTMHRYRTMGISYLIPPPPLSPPPH